tara:strand:+ start:383 stop:814 length:432 start_codon:yes stop_codon:yes gene_type:complete
MQIKKITFRKLYKFIKHKIKSLHPLTQQLDYNFNWKLKKKISRLLFKDQILQVIDIGAAGLSLGEINNFSRNIDYICFDSNDDEIQKIKKAIRLKNFIILELTLILLAKITKLKFLIFIVQEVIAQNLKLMSITKKLFLKTLS